MNICTLQLYTYVYALCLYSDMRICESSMYKKIEQNKHLIGSNHTLRFHEQWFYFKKYSLRCASWQLLNHHPRLYLVSFYKVYFLKFINLSLRFFFQQCWNMIFDRIIIPHLIIFIVYKCCYSKTKSQIENTCLYGFSLLAKKKNQHLWFISRTNCLTYANNCDIMWECLDCVD